MPFFSTLGGVIGRCSDVAQALHIDMGQNRHRGKSCLGRVGRPGVMGHLLNNLHCTAASACQSEHNGKASAGNIFNALFEYTTREDTREESWTQEKEPWDGNGALLVDEI